MQHETQRRIREMEDDMDKVGTRTDPAGEKPDVVESMTDLYSSGIDRLAEMQKKGLEIAVKHNAEVISTLKKQTWPVPGALMLDLGATAFEHFVDMQKGAIDLVVEQTHALADLMKERKSKATDTMEEGKKRAKEAIGHTIAAQKTALDYTAKQTKAAFEAAKKQFGSTGTPAGAAADSMQRGIEVVVEAQKDILDVFAEPALR
jgi:hypothetical protein